MNNDLVSICIPAFNAEKYLLKCLDSLISQSYGNIEIIIVDDASYDNTAKIANSFSDKRIKYYKNEKNLGWRKNVKRCYDLASGDYVTILPVDDYLDKNFTQEAVRSFEKWENLGIWSCGCVIVDINGKEIERNKRRVLGFIDSKEYFKQTFEMLDISPPAETMVRRQFIQSINGQDSYDGELKQFPEIELYLKISQMGFNAFNSDLYLTYRTRREDSLTGMYGSKPFVHLDRINIYDKYYRHYLLDEGNKKKSFHNIMNLISRDLGRAVKKRDFVNIKEYALFLKKIKSDPIYKKSFGSNNIYLCLIKFFFANFYRAFVINKIKGNQTY